MESINLSFLYLEKKKLSTSFCALYLEENHRSLVFDWRNVIVLVSSEGHTNGSVTNDDEQWYLEGDILQKTDIYFLAVLHLKNYDWYAFIW